ncbi:MAG TPA: acylphosphatase [Vicinamibacteria bacterium]
MEAEAEGERGALEALVRWCHVGPPAARVDRVEADWRAFAGDLGPFSARH